MKRMVFFFIFALSLIRCVSAQATVEILQPAKAGLMAVHFPALDGLETSAREQLAALQNSIAERLSKSGATDIQLSEAYGLLARVYHAYSLTPPAEECYLNAQRLSPKDFRWVYLLACLYQGETRTADAIAVFQIARKLQPDYPATPVNLGNLFLQDNRANEARQAFKDALAINDRCAAAHYGLGQAALSERRYAEAVNHFNQALANAPSANRINYSLAMAHRGLGEMEKAAAYLEQQGKVGVRVADPLRESLLELPSGERLFLIRGRLAIDAGRFAEAAEEFKKAIAANPQNATALVNLGSALARSGKTGEAIERFQAAIKLEPGNAIAHYNLGFLLADQQMRDQAIIHLQTALKFNPKDTEARFKLANQFFYLRKYREAADELSKVVEDDPENEDALLELAKLRHRDKQYKTALEVLERGHKLYPNKGQTAALLAFMLATIPQMELRDGARAVELAKKIYLATGFANHGAIVAQSLAESGRCDEAAEWQRRMIVIAETERKPDLVKKLKAELPLFENKKTCRPGTGSGLNE